MVTFKCHEELFCDLCFEEMYRQPIRDMFESVGRPEPDIQAPKQCFACLVMNLRWLVDKSISRNADVLQGRIDFIEERKHLDVLCQRNMIGTRMHELFIWVNEGKVEVLLVADLDFLPPQTCSFTSRSTAGSYIPHKQNGYLEYKSVTAIGVGTDPNPFIQNRVIGQQYIEILIQVMLTPSKQ